MSSIKKNVMIETHQLKKYFATIKAVDGIDLQIQQGEIYSLLGPNGAGKSTTIKILTTVLSPDAGEIIIANNQLATKKESIRKLIGVCPQDYTFYEDLSAEENLIFVAQMHGIPFQEAKLKADQLLKKMGIAGRKDRVKNFSGGMKRRLNLVMALIHEPKIAFLDEPTAGLDPQARRIVWDFIQSLKGSGMTIVLTTHDMAEADTISDHVAIIDQGKIIAFGTPVELKQQFGTGNVVEVDFFDHPKLEMAKSKLNQSELITKISILGEQKLLISFGGGIKTFVKILNMAFDRIEDVESLNLRQNTLEDVFLHLTGKRLRDK